MVQIDTLLGDIPYDVLLKVLQVRERIQNHILQVALEGPQAEHGSDCHDNEGYREDWNGTWWNIVGTGLLNGLNQLAYHDAIKRLALVSVMGRMNRQCFLNGLAMAETVHLLRRKSDLVKNTVKEVEIMIKEVLIVEGDGL